MEACYTAAMRSAPPKLIGMVHLLPLPGSPGARPMDEVLHRAELDAATLVKAGFEAVMVENYGDLPFHPERVPAITIAAMARAALTVRGVVEGRATLGINVLRNDARAALAVATACEAASIRVNVHTGARLADQGLIQGRAWETLRLCREWGGEDVAIWADVEVKHSVALGQERPLRDEVEDLVQRGLADAVVVSGRATGEPVGAERVADVKRWARDLPVLVGSGVTVDTVESLLEVADACIVGTSIKQGGVSCAPVDVDRASELVVRVRGW